MMATKTSDPMATVPRSKDYAWWLENIDHRITPEFRALLENYSKIPPEDVRQHIYNIREKAWNIRQYPCTGMARFLDNLVTRSPAYSTVISRLQNGDSFVDIGCFLGQELRQIVADGAPTENLHAVDIVNHWDLGYEFFRDADRFKIDLIEEDMMHPGKGLQALQGKMDIILVNQVFHQWVLEVQMEAAVELVKLSRPGSLIIGYQAGVPVPRESSGPKGSQYKSLKHSPETWKKMWDDVGERTGTVFKTEAKLLTWEELGHDPEETAYLGRDVMMLEFVITREK